MTQDFFVSLMERDWLRRADSERGRFRTFLRMQLRGFVADQTSPRRLPRQKDFERRIASLEAVAGVGDQSYEPAAGETPDEAFDRAFARSVVHAVRGELRKTCATEKRPDWYEIFAAAYPEDLGTEPSSQQTIADRFGKTRDEVRGILDRMKKRCLRLLRNELRDHGGETDIEAEADELLRLLSR